MKLFDLIDEVLLGDMYDQGMIRVQYHPHEDLAILNYTEKAAYEAAWNDATLKCRGLIYNYMTGDIIARPFEKFFNYEQLGPDWTPPKGSVGVTDKADGSLGILYPLPDGTWAVATRGSFASDQAAHATRIFNERYKDKMVLDPDFTFLFEIIYPENRIVLNYGDMDDLVLLGGVVIDNGVTFGPREARLISEWPGPIAEIMSAYSWADALALPPRPNAEGIVVLFHETGERVKLKQEDYVALHRIVTGMSDRKIWEALGEGMSVEDIKKPLPEEFWPWVDDVAMDLYEQAHDIIVSVFDEHVKTLRSLPANFTRKDFALAVKDSPNRGYLFKYLDGQGIWDVVWKSIKPEAGRSMTKTTED